MDLDIIDIVSHFSITGQVRDFMPYGKGHINDTFLVRTFGDETQDYILQKINHLVFKNVPELMDNIRVVTEHIRNNRSSEQGKEEGPECLQLIMTKNNLSYYHDPTGDFWRCFNFIPGAIIYEKAANTAIAMEAGRAIGRFQASLSDLDQKLHETLPRFHSFHSRFEEFKQALKINSHNRKAKAGEEIAFTEARVSEMEDYFLELKSGNIPIRVTHNDTKVNNIIFNQENKAVCLIDFDTVMPGYVHFDYGDALRTLANTAEEDEPELDKVGFSYEFFRSFTLGYLEETKGLLNSEELRLLPFAPRYMTFIIGLRFLNDYLMGDVYFKTSEPGHNLRRTRVQFKLLESIEKQYDKIINFIG
jgi:hypothetical protein